MFCLSLNLTSDEWLKIQQASPKQWPGEVLSRREICRRYLLAGIEGLKGLPEADRSRLAHKFQDSMTTEEKRLRT